jgi:hypothetical protein
MKTSDRAVLVPDSLRNSIHEPGTPNRSRYRGLATSSRLPICDLGVDQAAVGSDAGAGTQPAAQCCWFGAVALSFPSLERNNSRIGELLALL